MAEFTLDEVVAAVAGSRRYRHVAPVVIARLAREEIPSSRNLADAQKRTQRRLHQIFGAYYYNPLPYDRLLERLRAARGDKPRFKQVCAEILRGHASTAERLPVLDCFYDRVFNITGPPQRILDLASGLNPLTIPWMRLPALTSYLAADIDGEMIRFLNGFFETASIPGRAVINDLIAGPPQEEADVALVLKTVACLQHQIEDVGSILDAIRARWVVISFPTRSLGRQSKGMERTYRTSFEKLAASRPWSVRELTVGMELVFVVNRLERP